MGRSYAAAWRFERERRQDFAKNRGPAQKAEAKLYHVGGGGVASLVCGFPSSQAHGKVRLLSSDAYEYHAGD
jgi:hypothetical protein